MLDSLSDINQALMLKNANTAVKEKSGRNLSAEKILKNLWSKIRKPKKRA